MDKAEYNRELTALAVLLRKGLVSEAVSAVPGLIRYLQSLSQGKAEDELKQIALCTRGIVNSFQAGDYISMADIIEYELAPYLRGGHES